MAVKRWLVRPLVAVLMLLPLPTYAAVHDSTIVRRHSPIYVRIDLDRPCGRSGTRYSPGRRTDAGSPVGTAVLLRRLFTVATVGGSGAPDSTRER